MLDRVRPLCLILLLSIATAQNRPDTPQEPPPIPAELQPFWDKYEMLIDEFPEEPLLHYNFGNLAYGNGDYAKALEEYKQSLASGDRLAKARSYYNLGNALYRGGEIETARDLYRKALELDPFDQDARINYELAMKQAEEEEQQKSDSPASDQESEDEQEEPSEEGEQQEGEDQQGDEDKPGDEQEPDEQEGESKPKEAGSEPKEREEAEAILNAMKANEDNLMQRQYKPAKAAKLEKDW